MRTDFLEMATRWQVPISDRMKRIGLRCLRNFVDGNYHITRGVKNEISKMVLKK